MKIAICQMKVSMKKSENIEKALKFIEKACKEKVDLVVLPEMFNCPYDNSYFEEFSEEGFGETAKALSNCAKKNKIYIVGGSIPERSEDKIYNTSYVFDRSGNVIAKHRKAHLFDIDIKDKIRFMESDVLTSGEKTTVFETEFGKIGVMICYDIRFPEFTRKMVLEGADMVIVPGAFNMTTGPVHWELTAKVRGLDNQIYMVMASPARDEEFSYVAYGHSLITNPWGETINTLNEEEGILIQEIDFEYLKKIRESLPLLKHRREKLY